MKKRLILSIFILASYSLFADMEVERGYGNLEFVTKYSNFSTNDKDFNFIKEMHKYIENQNDYLYQESNTLDIDKDLVIRPYFITEQRKKYNNIGGGLSIFHSYEQGVYIGLNAEGRKITFKPEDEKEKKITANRGTFRVFYNKIEDEKNFLISPYYTFDNLKGIRNRVVGIYAKQEIPLNLAKFNLIENGLKGYLEIDTHRISVQKPKEKNSKEKFENKNDSINGTIGLIYSPEAYEYKDFKLKTKASIGYNKEFLEKRKYKTFNEKDDNTDNLKAKVNLDFEYKNINLGIEDVYTKSLNSKNYENKVSAKITYRF